MGKTHLSGLEIGDPGIDIWASPSLNQKVRVTQLAAQMRLHSTEGMLITEVRVINTSRALVVATVQIGTGTTGPARLDIFSGATTAGAALKVEKYAPAGIIYVELTAGTVGTALDVIVSYIAALN
jgi:hypothetical protein